MYDDIADLSLPPSRTAYFFDFDGTLAEIAENPSAAAIGVDVLHALAGLHEASGGALAVISGREIATLDDFLSPLRLPLGGAHGSERRDARGELHSVKVDRQAIEHVLERLTLFSRGHPGLLVETKRTSVALHYRRRPELEAACRRVAQDIAARDGLALLEGKMVIELKLGGRTKGDLIADFMAEEPFRGRQPIFFGDDVTDEDAFRVLPRWEGIGVKIGEGPTAATHRIPNPPALHAWLYRLTGMVEVHDHATRGGTEGVGSS